MGEQHIRKYQGIRVTVFLAAVVLSIFSPARAAEEYQFERMWPSLPAPWYFRRPAGVAVDATGNVYVVNIDSNRIQKFSSSGEFLDEWGSSGTGDGQFNRPTGIAVDGSGNVYVADTYNDRIQKFSSSGEFLDEWGSKGSGNGQFDRPTGIAVDSKGRVYVADTYNNRIQEFSATGSFLTKWGSPGDGDRQFSSPQGVAVDGTGAVYVADTGNNRIKKFTSLGGFITAWGSYGSGNGQFSGPGGIAAGSGGSVYVADTGNQRIQKFSSTGMYLTTWGSSGSGNGQFDYPQALGVDASGNIYVSDTYNDRILKFTNSGEFLAAWGGQSDLQGCFANPTFIVVDDYGTVYVADSSNYRVQAFTPEGVYLTEWGTYGTGNSEFEMPYGIGVDASSVYVADYENSRIQKFSLSGTYVSQWGYVNHPMGIAADKSGNVYVADNSNHRVVKFSSTGTYLTEWGGYGTGNGQFVSAVDIAIDSNGNVYVADSTSNRIQKFTADGNFILTWGSSGSEAGLFENPIGIGVDRRGFVYVADSGNNRIQKFSGTGTFVAMWGSEGYGEGQFSSPLDVAVDGNGLVYVTDWYNNRIQVFSRVPGGDRYFPHIASTNSWKTEIAIINTGSTLKGSLLAFDSAGGLLPDPIELTMSPHQRMEFTIGLEFADADSIDYLILESDSPDVRGYTKFYRPGLYRVAIPAVSEAATGDIPVTHIASNDFWWTGIAFLNTTGSNKNLTIDFNTGAAHTVSLAPHEHQSFCIHTIFGGAPQPVVQSAIIRGGSGIIGLELFGSDNRLEGIPLSDETATTLYYPHVASNATWWTGIVAYNPSESGCDLLITPYSAAGTALPVLSQALGSHEKYVGTVDNLAFPAGTAWFTVTSSTPVSGFELFGTREGGQLGGFSSIGIPGDSRVFAKMEPSGWTGIALVNPSAAAATVTLSAYDDSGTVRAVTTRTLNKFEKIVEVAENLFPGQDLSAATYIGYTSTQNVVGFQLNGSEDGTMLDGLPGM